jgi:predicted nucleic acid-binding protein
LTPAQIADAVAVFGCWAAADPESVRRQSDAARAVNATRAIDGTPFLHQCPGSADGDIGGPELPVWWAAGTFDAWAALALLRGEGAAAASVRRYVRRAQGGNLRLVLNLINLGEVYYRMAQLAGEDRATEGLELLRELPIEFVQVKESVVLEAARLKAAHRLSYADAFAVATGRLEQAPVLTGDPEILALPRSVVQVRALSR